MNFDVTAEEKEVAFCILVGTFCVLVLAIFWYAFSSSYAFPWNLPVFVLGFGSAGIVCCKLLVRRLDRRLEEHLKKLMNSDSGAGDVVGYANRE